MDFAASGRPRLGIADTLASRTHSAISYARSSIGHQEALSTRVTGTSAILLLYCLARSIDLCRVLMELCG